MFTNLIMFISFLDLISKKTINRLDFRKNKLTVHCTYNSLVKMIKEPTHTTHLIHL